MATYEIIQPDPAATTYDIGDGTYADFYLMDGVGMSEIRRTLQYFPNISGALDKGYKFQPRELTLKLFYQVATKALADARRDQIYKIFRPFDDPLKLKVTRDDGSVRQIDVNTVGMLDLPESRRTGSDQAFDVRLQAPDPFWYDPTPITTTFTPNATPYAGSITYAGNWEEYPVIKVYGEVLGFTMEITPSGGSSEGTISISYDTIADGDYYTIDLRPGYKTVKTSGGTNKDYTAVVDPAALALSRLWPDPEAAGGVNDFSFSYTSKGANHKIEVTYYKRYLGL